MRSRLSTILLALMASVLLSLGVPLALSIAAAQARAVYLDRLADVARFASLTPGTLDDAVDRDALREELVRYDAVYGVATAVLDAGGGVTVASRPGAIEGADQTVVRAALAGRQPDPPSRLLPWDREPMIVAQPLVREGDVVGALLSVSDTATARGRVTRSWLLLGGAELAALMAAAAIADRLARWVLRPVAVLDRAAHRIAGGDLGTRIPVGSGPQEVRRLAGSFNDMAEHVQASMEAQRAFVADASHQLRNPLGALLVRLESLVLTAPAEHRAAAASAVDDGRYLADTLERMLELARAEHTDTAAGVLDVGELVDERLRSWQVVAERRHITLCRVGEPHVHGWHEPAAVSGAFDAVVDNAVKYSPEGSTVTIDVGAVDDTAQITVTDTGPGLDDDDLGRVADRFWRSRRHPNTPGTGLGMSIARTLVERHAGSLSVTPVPDGGLRVRLVLPRPPRSGLVPAEEPDGRRMKGHR